MRSKTQAQARPATAFTDALTAFRCGCGQEYFSREQFKDHSLLIHRGLYIRDSTHFLSSLTEVVLPVQESNSTQKDCEQQLSLKQTTAKDVCRKKQTKNSHSPINKQTRLNAQRNTERTPIKQKQILIKEQRTPTKEQRTPIKVQRKPIKRQRTPIKDQTKLKISNIPQQINEQVEWNGFRLVKNKRCSFQPYYCGFCRITFTLPEEFIVHCIEECKQLKNVKSSHSITCDFYQNSIQQKTDDQALPEENDTSITIRQKKPAKSTIVSTQYSRSLDPFKDIYHKHLDHRNHPFYCGTCHRSFQMAKCYYTHIIKSHSQVISPSSSHVVLRFSNPNMKIAQIYISQNISWIHNDPIYFCPCKPEKMMDMSILVSHVMEVHRGISPFYYNFNFSTKAVADPIQLLIKKRIFSKRPTLLQCFTCNKQFGIRGYWAHCLWHLTYDSEQTPRILSHILLRANMKTYLNRNIYLSPSEEWENEDAVYYCPCEPEKKVKMGELLQHHIKVHKYVSPVYEFNEQGEQ